MSNPYILIGDVPSITTDFSIKLDGNQYRGLKHRKRYFGGDWDMTFFLPDAIMGTALLDEYFNTWLMANIAEYFNGEITWRGVIWEMTRIKDGKRQVRSTSNVWNAVKCIYTETSTNLQYETDFEEDDNSIARYLRREYIVYKDNVTSTQASAAAAKFLNEHYDAWPKATDFNVSGEDGIEVTAFGMSRLFNNILCTEAGTQESVDVDTFVDDIWDTDLAPNLSFLVLGGIDTNDYEVERQQRAPTRCGDLIDALARGGDSDLPYRWYIGQDLQFRFEIMNTSPTMEWLGLKRGGLHKVDGPVATWNATPGVMVDKTMPEVPALPGSFLNKRNYELIEQFSMWQDQDQPVPETEEATEATLLAHVEQYKRMIVSNGGT